VYLFIEDGRKAHLYEFIPGLTSLKSADLSPVSWMSVAWYDQIYI
jgi:hypothetical protein